MRHKGSRERSTVQATLTSITTGMGLIASIMAGGSGFDPSTLADMVADLGRQAVEVAATADQLAGDLAVMEAELRAGV